MSGDEWTTTGVRVTDDDVLKRLQQIIEDESDLIVEHRFYRGASAPHRFICAKYAELERYLKTAVSPGDSFYFWCIEECCRDENVAAKGKVPDVHGRVPSVGAY